MPASPLALVLALLAPAGIELTAERLEATPDGWSATALGLELPPMRLDAAAARAVTTAECPRGRVGLTDVRLTRASTRGRAAAARICLAETAGPLEVERLTLEGPRLRARAAAARWREQRLEADDVWISPCGCADPPWSVSARRATVTPGDGAWLTWPVLRAGDVPVLAAPVAYVPLTRRRTGFLAPRLGYDGEDGLYGALPLFWAALDTLDLTVAPGWRAGFTADGRIRWAATPHEDGEVEAFTAPFDGQAVVFGRGTAPLGPLRLALDGQWADSGESWRRRRPGFVDRSRRHLHADVGAAAVAGDLGLGLRASRFERLDGPEAHAITAPTAWLRVGAGFGPLRLALDGAATQVWRPGVDGEVFDLALSAESRHWLGPVALRPVLAGRTRVHPDAEAPQQTLAAMAGFEAAVAVRRPSAAGLHRIGLTLDARWAAATGRGPHRLDHADRPLDARDVGLTLSTGLSGRRWAGRVSIRAGYDGLAAGPAPVWLRARLDGPWVGLGLDGAADGGLDARAAYLDGRLGSADGPRIRLGGAWVRAGAELPWLRPVGSTSPTLQVPAAYLADADADPEWLADDAIAGLTAGLTLPVGPLTAGWTAGLDLSPGASAMLVGQIGTLDWRGRCDCWSAGLWIGHETGRPAPDAMLRLTLGQP